MPPESARLLVRRFPARSSASRISTSRSSREPDAEVARLDPQRLLDREERVEVELLRDEPDGAAREPVVAHHVLPEHAHLARGRAQEPGDDGDEGRLPGAVRAEEREDLARAGRRGPRRRARRGRRIASRRRAAVTTGSTGDTRTARSRSDADEPSSSASPSRRSANRAPPQGAGSTARAPPGPTPRRGAGARHRRAPRRRSTRPPRRAARRPPGGRRARARGGAPPRTRLPRPSGRAPSPGGRQSVG